MRTRRGKRSEVWCKAFLMLLLLHLDILYVNGFTALQAFWPSIVMKKWLNIKPKVYDFSEDEVDTASESEDDGRVLICLAREFIHNRFYAWLCVCNSLPVCSLKDARVHTGEDHACGIQRNQSVFTNQTLGSIWFVFHWFDLPKLPFKAIWV